MSLNTDEDLNQTQMLIDLVTLPCSYRTSSVLNPDGPAPPNLEPNLIIMIRYTWEELIEM